MVVVGGEMFPRGAHFVAEVVLLAVEVGAVEAPVALARALDELAVGDASVVGDLGRKRVIPGSFSPCFTLCISTRWVPRLSDCSC